MEIRNVKSASVQRRCDYVGVGWAVTCAFVVIRSGLNISVMLTMSTGEAKQTTILVPGAVRGLALQWPEMLVVRPTAAARRGYGRPRAAGIPIG